MVQLTPEQAKAILDFLMTRPAGDVITAIDWLRTALAKAEQAATTTKG